MEEDEWEWERADDVKGVPFVVGVDGVIGAENLVSGRLQDGRTDGRKRPTIGIYVAFAFACHFYGVNLTRGCPHPGAMVVIPNDNLNVGK